MKNLFICVLILLVIVSVTCNVQKEHFYTPGLTHVRNYTFTPYFMNNTIDVSKRGCETSKYWNCVDNHPKTKNGYEINKVPDDVDQDCKKHSNSQCYFPEFISHSKQEPYFQYLHYV